MQQARHVGKLVLSVPQPAVRGEGAYLVVGGLGALGQGIGEWLARQGAGCVVLAGRRTPDHAVREWLDRLRASSKCAVHTEQLNVANSAAVRALLARFGQDWPSLRGIVHAAGTLDDGVLTEQRWDRFEGVLRPKAVGAWHLHLHSRGQLLDFFLLYSSVASVMGAAGQGNYAAANAFLDGLAEHRQSLGLPAISINWGPWGETGMASSAAAKSRLSRTGFGFLTPEAAYQALARMMRSGVAQGTILSVDWNAVQRSLGKFAILEQVTDNRSSSKQPDEEKPFSRLLSVPRMEQLAFVERHVQTELQRVLRLHTTPDKRAGMVDLGLDSLMAVELRNRLQCQVPGSLSLPTTLAFDYPTVVELSQFLTGRIVEALGDRQPYPPFSSPTSQTPVASSDKDGASEKDLDLALRQKLKRYARAPK
jgi:NAD(P)-dependent dehydrogenase (short-subunit alcohol dehydrogenase family)